MKNFSVFRLFCIALLLCATTIYAREPYAVLSNGNTVLTFYYDNQKAARGGMSVGPFDVISYPPNISWYAQKETIATVVFDASFSDCTTLTSTAGWFYTCINLTTITGIENLKTDNVTDMYGMFAWCSSLTNVDVSGFKTDNVTDMRYMFAGCSSLTYLDVSRFKTDNVTSMYCMFQGCSSLTSLDVSGFKTGKVTEMQNMFLGCSSLNSLDVSGFKTDNVVAMGAMFKDCSSLRELDVSGFTTDKVELMGAMFDGCSSLTNLDVSGFKTDKVKYIAAMFRGCSSLKSLDVSGFNISNVTEDEYYGLMGMFDGCFGLTSLDLSGFRTDKVPEMAYMFRNCSSLTTIFADSELWSNAKVKDGGEDMFKGCSKLVGGKGTAYNDSHIDYSYAHIDGGSSNPGYFTYRRGTLSGDVNADGQVGIGDIVAITNFMAGNGSGITLVKADVNGDDEVGIGDIVAITNIMAGIDITKAYLECPDEHHPHLIDLGLPSGTLWACSNVGADKPDDYGLFFAWGETTGFGSDTSDGHSFDQYNYKWFDQENRKVIKYVTEEVYGDVDNKFLLDPEDDAAYAAWGERWRTPTDSQLNELLNCTSHEVFSKNGVKGLRFTAANGGKLFLPASGGRMEAEILMQDSVGYYWSSSLKKTLAANTFGFTALETTDLMGLGITENMVIQEPSPVFAGFSVRPVKFDVSTMFPNLELSLAGSIATIIGGETKITVISGSGHYGVESSNEDAVTAIVSEEEITITAHAVGTFEITVKDLQSGQAITISVTVKAIESFCPDENHPHLIDLGLPSGTLWACCNVGTNMPDSHGLFFAWGETEGYGSDTSDGRLFSNEYNKWYEADKYQWNKYVTNKSGYADNKLLLDPEDDAAYVAWGSEWRMPTYSQMRELINNTFYTESEKGMLFTAANGNAIFLPASGFRIYSEIRSQNVVGSYWSSSLSSNFWYAQSLCFDYEPSIDDKDRGLGCNVRPVKNAPSAMFADFRLSSNGPLYLAVGESFDLDIVSGNNVYSYSSNNESVATVNQSNYNGIKSFSIDAQGVGTADITIIDENTSQSVTIRVNVSLADFKLSSLEPMTLLIGDISSSVYIVSGNGDYSVTSSNVGAATATLQYNTIVVEAIGIGSTDITVTDTSLGQSATIHVTVIDICPDNNHPHMIDLGLPSGTKWACCNVGANAPTSYGNYYAWGETNPKSVYNWDTYLYGSSVDNVVNIGSDIAGTSYDAATVHWGASWRMPSQTQIQELLDNCSSTWTSRDGLKGRYFSGSNGGKIFLPAAGFRWYEKSVNIDYNGLYWSSTCGQWFACSLCFDSEGAEWVHGDLGSRETGGTIRPVCQN